MVGIARGQEFGELKLERVIRYRVSPQLLS